MSARRAPRDLRASDADRDRVLALLAEAVSDGRITADEHSERVQRACSARTLGELAGLTADLAEPSAQPVRLDGGRAVLGFGGTVRRDGRWVVPESLSVTVMLGEVELDFTQAILQANPVRLYATVLGGRLRLIVPDGLAVTVTGPVIVGRRRGGTRLPARANAPVIDVRAAVVGGEVLVRTPPRPRRRLFSRRG
jgi:Domain of unknown function (DUF1707)/Cell wall-active antibiotics response 4TMS YvqF